MFQVSSNGYISIGAVVERFEKVEYPLDNADADPVIIAAYRARMQYRPDEELYVFPQLSQHSALPLNLVNIGIGIKYTIGIEA